MPKPSLITCLLLSLTATLWLWYALEAFKGCWFPATWTFVKNAAFATFFGFAHFYQWRNP